ncbi:hypothetical protein ACFQXA_22890 [Nocardiopsis composta]
MLRSWLRAPERPVPWDRLDAAMALVTEGLGATLRGGAPPAGREPARVLVAVYPSGADTSEVLDRVREALRPDGCDQG